MKLDRLFTPFRRLLARLIPPGKARAAQPSRKTQSRPAPQQAAREAAKRARKAARISRRSR
ncbi:MULTISPECIES: hypothetical protein [unclassified Paracoccus (in: a-proteobacteria)]|uniref:hypothetical protein n=1 Tax=unclassified Paracoccus (in: a-proteobacteria) TaxID=2688777 RepID=UPI0012B1EC38|nr:MULTISPECIES: hypothetical protein [unclassified Paracoccus (in: a-proteobacteria)]UXU76355.1 hypothetical protein GB879_014805 [Paracoccus sp. SMMA_5]UXU82307.1 hypothetical protein GB880_015140 [Paracoccus sp. SMMA_5_TC]